MALKLRPDPHSGPDFFLVFHDGLKHPVGRIFCQTAPDGRGEEWFWGLGFPYTLNEPPPFYGTVASRDEAMQCFRQCWERKQRIP